MPNSRRNGSALYAKAKARYHQDNGHQAIGASIPLAGSAGNGRALLPSALPWCVLGCVAAWALIPLVATHTGSLSPDQFLFWSNTVTAIFLLTIAPPTRIRRHLKEHSRPELRLLAAMGALGGYAYAAPLYSAYAVDPVSTPTIMAAHFLWPVFMLLFSGLLIGQRVMRSTLAAAALGLFAVGALTSTDGQTSLTSAVLAALGAAAIFGLHSSLIRLVSYDARSGTAIGFCAAAGLSFLSMEWRSEWAWPTGEGLWAVLINGLLINGLASLWWARALHAAPAQVVAPWVSLTPLLAAGVVTASSTITLEWTHWAGLMVVLLAGLFASRPSPSAVHFTPSQATTRGRCLAHESL